MQKNQENRRLEQHYKTIRLNRHLKKFYPIKNTESTCFSQLFSLQPEKLYPTIPIETAPSFFFWEKRQADHKIYMEMQDILNN